MIKVELWDYCYRPDEAGIIVEFPTGVVYTNQTCGTCCRHPEMEGLYIPVFFDECISDNLVDYTYLKESDCEMIESGLLHTKQKFIRVDRDRLDDSHEAWIYLKILENNDPMFKNLIGKTAVLTYMNSD